jgi:hypothetical protein
LLEAYGFLVFAEIALIGAICSFVLAALLALLVAFGFVHARKTPQTEEIFATQTVATETIVREPALV